MAAPKSNIRLAVNLSMIVLGMAMLAYASVPLYRLFCQVTGYGGTTVQAETLPTTVSDRKIKVTFNADISKKLPWEFKPGERLVEANVGEQMLTYYTAENLTQQPVSGHATYNVVPHKAGPYFAKIECFCFERQTLEPGQHVNMPISFYIDPAILDDPEMDDVQTITLSYTFFPVEEDT